ncbi:uncharacterized protein LOC122041128 [Zingiber officinale]|uniref:uncharacterized protein LOC122041128 n=1 Tax=Zingiber officinale TaxID=94328 RepID=UPI001C4D2D1A|nr:uncharacterized protein LOC122041128 [Zingiber officinale]
MNPVKHCNRIELRSERTLGDPQISAQKGINSEEQPSPLMPNLVQNKDKEEITKKVEGTLPLPPQIYTLTRQKGDFETVALTEKCSALLMADIPPKLQDPRSFSIPCKIGSELIQKAFCDLGASVSLLPYSLCKKLGLQNIKLTTMALQLADHSSRYLMGIVEDVPVEVGGCIIPIDFIVLDMEEDPKIPIILGRPFLTTAGVLIDVKNHKLSLEISKKKDVHNLHELAVIVSWEWGRQRSQKGEGRDTMRVRESVV